MDLEEVEAEHLEEEVAADGREEAHRRGSPKRGLHLLSLRMTADSSMRSLPKNQSLLTIIQIREQVAAPRMPCVVLRVDGQKLYDRSISDMMCVWCKGYYRPGSASAVSPYCVLENT